MWHLRPLPPFMANAILNFHFDYWHTSLSSGVDAICMHGILSTTGCPPKKFKTKIFEVGRPWALLDALDTFLNFWALWYFWALWALLGKQPKTFFLRILPKPLDPLPPLQYF